MQELLNLFPSSVIALTHFCETHGPSVVFTTQEVSSASVPKKLPVALSLVNLHTPLPPQGVNAPGEEEGCPSCRSLPDGSGVLCDTQARSYISSHHPFTPIYRAVRNACVRSLSCELAPGREGPVFFTSGEHYQVQACSATHELGVLSYVFRITDNHARGSARWYSILLLHSDVSLILGIMPWISTCLQAIATDMQFLAQLTAKGMPVPQVHASAPLSRTLGSFRRAARSASLHSLVELMNDKSFFYRLHTRFSWLLCSCAQSSAGSKVPQMVVSKVTTKEISTHINMGTLKIVLGLEGFRVAVYNMLIGNQVIIRGDSSDIAAGVARLLQLCLPGGCVSSLVCSTVYKEIWEASLLALPAGSSIPTSLSPDSFVLIDFSNTPDQNNILADSRWVVKGVFQLTTLGQAIEKIAGLENEHECLDLLVEEWLAKAKTYTKLRQIVEAQKDKRLADYAHALGLVHKADFNVLAFWTTGLRQLLKHSQKKRS